MQANRPDEAYVLLQEIADQTGDFPGLQDALIEAQDSSNIKARYEQANVLIEKKEWSRARLLLEEISESDPNYRDVSLLLSNLDNLEYLSGIFEQAQRDFEEGNWEEASARFETLRALDPNYKTNEVSDELFQSYVNAARYMLVDKEDSLKALVAAEGYFRKALALQPQNPNIKSERELARLYIDAQSNFLTKQWTDVIAAMEIVYARDSSYAAGAALQTLYEAYVARGDSRMSSGEFEEALLDYQRAIYLAEQDTQSTLRLYEAHLKAAESHGALHNYEAAVFLYRSAVELSDLKLRAQGDNPTQLVILEQAEAFASEGNFSVAYERYRSALGIVPGNFCLSFTPYQEALYFNTGRQSMKNHTVAEGEYLNLIANRYQSTVCAIVLANDIADPDTIYTGQVLAIPVMD
jgi:tetratricopeptide (TPR) repeat protein